MQRIRKPLPVSLRRLITERDRNQRSLAKSRVLAFQLALERSGYITDGLVSVLVMPISMAKNSTSRNR